MQINGAHEEFADFLHYSDFALVGFYVAYRHAGSPTVVATIAQAGINHQNRT